MKLLDVGSWVKIFDDGSLEHGHDCLIKEHKASWSRGRLSGIKEVFLSDGLLAATLEVPDTEWHQFDRYMAFMMNESESIRKGRFVQAKILPEHVGMYLCYNNQDIRLVWASVKDKPIGPNCRLVTPDDVGQWLTIKVSHREQPIVFLAERGSRSGKQLFK